MSTTDFSDEGVEPVPLGLPEQALMRLVMAKSEMKLIILFFTRHL